MPDTGVAYARELPGHQLAQHQANLQTPFPPRPYVTVTCSCGWQSEWQPAIHGFLAFNAGQQHLADQIGAT